MIPIYDKHGNVIYEVSGANLSGADLSRANLSGADLSRANLSGADLSGADLSETNLSGADLSRANLSGADLSGADLSKTNLSRANLFGADLSGANLFGADLSGANLSRADLSGANLSRTLGLLDPIAYLSLNFKSITSGIIAYKTFSHLYKPPAYWDIAEGAVISEEVNSNRQDTCGCGINVGSLAWIESNNTRNLPIWEVLIEWSWLSTLIVPYNADGKVRVGRCRLIRKLK